jgi:hypothetical protein
MGMHAIVRLIAVLASSLPAVVNAQLLHLAFPLPAPDVTVTRDVAIGGALRMDIYQRPPSGDATAGDHLLQSSNGR